MRLPIFQVDAFTDRLFGGNPAGVCILPQPRDESWMQSVAAEMNLSETAFLVKQADGFDLRWFTPTVEVDLCGHATLASAHILWETGTLKKTEQARFHTRSGLLTAELMEGWIELNFPSTPDEPATAPADLMKGLNLNVTAKYVGKSRFDYLLELDSEGTVRRLAPDFTVLKQVTARGIIVTSLASTPGYDFVSRFFGPAAGVNEDPVTGSAHSCLGPYWKRRLNRNEFVAYQASARGGVLRIRVSGDRVFIAGQAVTFLRGEVAE